MWGKRGPLERHTRGLPAPGSVASPKRRGCLLCARAKGVDHRVQLASRPSILSLPSLLGHSDSRHSLCQRCYCQFLGSVVSPSFPLSTVVFVGTSGRRPLTLNVTVSSRRATAATDAGVDGQALQRPATRILPAPKTVVPATPAETTWTCQEGVSALLSRRRPHSAEWSRHPVPFKRSPAPRCCGKQRYSRS